MAEQNESQSEILKRLRRVEGQIRGIQRMIEEGRSCEEVVTQLMAARAALDRAGLLIMSQHIEQCLLDPSGATNRAQLERITAFFLKLSGSAPSPEEYTGEPIPEEEASTEGS
ncbi:MAG: metal-sensitive transcriptional regulator [Anaerolineae bacterium]|nr:metal-sensitive transcriptional regulator [Anaerolineae bacterium]